MTVEARIKSRLRYSVKAAALTSRDRSNMRAEIGAAHQRLAALEPIDGIGPEIVGGVLVDMLDDPPERPQEIAHRLVEHHAAAIVGRRRAAEISQQQGFVLLGAEGSLDREIAQI